MNLSLKGAWIGITRTHVHVQPAHGQELQIPLEDVDAFICALNDARQTADALNDPTHVYGSPNISAVHTPVREVGLIEAIENVVEIGEQIA